ncbi:MAG: hypothetical protein HKN17_03980 [Rhodothermales bacterium]|nr:hypothetical protein [Rhodothermales bacterium]
MNENHDNRGAESGEVRRALSSVRERAALSERESDELLERIFASAGLAAESDVAHGASGSDPRASASRRDGAPSGQAIGTRPRRILHTAFKRTIGIAAAAVITILIVFLVREGPITLVAVPGDQLAADLPDGTSVILNSDTRLAYEMNRESGRSVTLEGEAWFDVAETGSTFRVRTQNAVVTVVGTQFSVRSRSDAGTSVTDVRVSEGRVSLEAVASESAPLILDPLRAGTVTGSSAVHVERSEAEFQDVPEWTRGDLVFRDMPYHEAVEEASRRLGVRIGLQVQSVADRRINAVFRAPLDTSTVLEGLCRPFGLRFRPAADGYEIFQPGNAPNRP